MGKLLLMDPHTVVGPYPLTSWRSSPFPSLPEAPRESPDLRLHRATSCCLLPSVGETWLPWGGQGLCASWEPSQTGLSLTCQQALWPSWVHINLSSPAHK